MKQKINPKDIRKGDLIRVEYLMQVSHQPGTPRDVAYEYVAGGDLDPHDSTVFADFYLLERPEPPFEPYWGMVIGEPHEHHNDGGVKAVYVPTGDGQNWFSHPEPEGKKGIYYFDDDWAKRKLAEGWVVIEKPGGVK